MSKLRIHFAVHFIRNIDHPKHNNKRARQTNTNKEAKTMTIRLTNKQNERRKGKEHVFKIVQQYKNMT